MKIIPISGAAGACDEPSGEIMNRDIPLTRRGFLKGSAILMGTIATTIVLFALAPSPVWALELTTLTQDEGTTLLQTGRVLYRHNKLPDAVYGLAGQGVGYGCFDRCGPRQSAAKPISCSLFLAGSWHSDGTRDHESHEGVNVLTVLPHQTQNYQITTVGRRFKRAFTWDSARKRYMPVGAPST